MQDVSSRIGFDKLGTAATLAWELEAAYSAGDLPVLRRVAAEGSQWWRRQGTHQAWDSTLHVGFALEEGRLEDAAVAYEHFVAGCPATKRQYYQRLKIGLAAAKGDRAIGPALFEELLSLPPPHDTADVLNTHDDPRRGSAAARHRAGRDPDVACSASGSASIRPRARWRAHVEGPLALAEGDHARAVSALQAVLAAPDPCLAKPIVGTLRTTLAEALLASGDRGTALLAIRRAIEDDFARWPGVRKDRAEALARRLQGASARADGELTAREREVAALVASGLTNGQLAERLFISPKTAAVHVSNILAKLGLSTRAEIAAWAVRHDLSA